MANVLNRNIGNTYPYDKDYQTSVDTNLYNPADWIINPDLSAVQGFSSIYWIISGDNVLLADQATRDARDAEILAQRIAFEKADNKQEYDNRTVIRALVLVLIDEINILRAQHSLNPRTVAQARTAIRNKIDEIT